MRVDSRPMSSGSLITNYAYTALGISCNLATTAAVAGSQSKHEAGKPNPDICARAPPMLEVIWPELRAGDVGNGRAQRRMVEQVAQNLPGTA